jgi:hypothetical protein
MRWRTRRRSNASRSWSRATTSATRSNASSLAIYTRSADERETTEAEVAAAKYFGIDGDLIAGPAAADLLRRDAE